MKIPRTRICLTNSHPRIKPDLARVEGALLRFCGKPSQKFRVTEIVLTTNSRIAGLAGKYRGRHKTTDVLAFPYDDFSGGCGVSIPLGEIIVSLDAAALQAMERGVDIEDEIILLCLHGLLHLCGIDDETREGWIEMRALEFENLSKIL